MTYYRSSTMGKGNIQQRNSRNNWAEQFLKLHQPLPWGHQSDL